MIAFFRFGDVGGTEPDSTDASYGAPYSEISHFSSKRQIYSGEVTPAAGRVPR
jgi:hypothetical protein